jgi:hypothetical protein
MHTEESYSGNPGRLWATYAVAAAAAAAAAVQSGGNNQVKPVTALLL